MKIVKNVAIVIKVKTVTVKSDGDDGAQFPDHRALKRSRSIMVSIRILISLS